jgi:hypothetical protein
MSSRSLFALRGLSLAIAVAVTALLGLTLACRGGARGSIASQPNDLLCGQPNDGLVHLPSNWETFTPQMTGQSYVDPVFGCTVKRITNGSLEEALWDGTHPSLVHYYSTLSPLNATDTMLLIASNDGAWRVRDTDGKIVVSAANMPAMNGGLLSWDAANGNVFYYTRANTLYKGVISGTSIKPVALHVFGEYSGIVSPDSADISQDGDHIGLVGQNSNNTMDIFVWSLSQGIKTSAYTTTCTVTGSVVRTGQPGCLHKLQLTANNLLSFQFAQDGNGTEQGLRLWDGKKLVRLQDATNHYDTGYDTSGNAVLIAVDNAATLAGVSNPCPSGWGLDVRMINNLSSAFCLLDKQPSWHISYRGGAPQPWLAISFFDTRTPGPEFFSSNPNYQAATLSNWQLYEDEIVVARVDGSALYRLAQARSRSMEDYWAQPHAAISRDGEYVIFTSNMAYPNGCPAGMHSRNQCSDVYLIKIRR